MKLFSVVGLLSRNGKILAVSRKTNHEDFGLPGGKIDPGESPEQALARELGEEIGITPLRFEVAFEDLDRVQDGVPRPCRTYRVLEWAGEPESKEGAAVAWVPPSRLLDRSCSFREYNRRLFHALPRLYEPLREEGIDPLFQPEPVK